MTKGTFGDHLKREREMRGVSLDEISTATRIAPRFLVAIENEQWEQLPGGVFNRGFVRAVAHYLGLDEESIVAEYALAVDDRPSVPVWTGTPPPYVPDRRWMNWVIAAVVLLALIGGCWFATRRILEWRANRRLAHGAPLSASMSASMTASTTAPPNSTSEPSPGSVSETASSGAANNSAAIPAGPAAGLPPATNPPANNAPINAPAAGAATVADSPMQLKIETVKKTKVTVQTDAHRVFDGTVKTGDIHTFSAKDRFQISTRDAGALVIQLNGKTLAPIGPLGRPGKITLSRDALKGGAGGDN